MSEGRSLLRIITYIGVIILQLIMTQVVTFLVTLFIPSNGNLAETRPVFLTFLLGLAFSAGVFWAGWLAIRQRWLPLKPNYLLRFIGALLGAYIPLIIFMVIYHTFAPGSPVFWLSIIGSILGFFVLGWDDKK